MSRPDISELFRISEAKFTEWASTIHNYQQKNNPIFRAWCEQFPTQGFQFLPIAFFKSHQVVTVVESETLKIKTVFRSSGTTQQTPSQHFVQDLWVYETCFKKGFEIQYGPANRYCFIGLLPSYLEREGSSLIYMVEKLISEGQPGSGFYLNQYNQVVEQIQQNEAMGIPTILFGVTFALLEMAATQRKQHWPNTIILETGGMKGRGTEITRDELHQRLGDTFGATKIHSEYGMTELMSQAYAKDGHRFVCPPWMRIQIQDPSDPKAWMDHGKTGRLCIIDLANVDSCSFIATDDLAKSYPDGSFEVMGRIDFSDLRGCNQLVL